MVISTSPLAGCLALSPPASPRPQYSSPIASVSLFSLRPPLPPIYSRFPYSGVSHLFAALLVLIFSSLLKYMCILAILFLSLFLYVLFAMFLVIDTSIFNRLWLHLKNCLTFIDIFLSLYYSSPPYLFQLLLAFFIRILFLHFPLLLVPFLRTFFILHFP